MAKQTVIVTPEFRAAFAEVFKPRAFEGGEPKYSVTMLFPKSTDLSALKTLAKAAIEAAWPNKEKRPKNLRTPFRDGNTVSWDGFAGNYFCRATTRSQPNVVDRNRQPILTPDGFYSGCYARASINAFTYNTAGNAGVAFGLQNVQFLRHGEPFTGRSDPNEDFDDLPDDGDDESGGPAAPEGLGDLGDLG